MLNFCRMSSHWQTFYETQAKPDNYDEQMKLVRSFVQSHLDQKVALISVSQGLNSSILCLAWLNFSLFSYSHSCSILHNYFNFHSLEELPYQWNIIPFDSLITLALVQEVQYPPNISSKTVTPLYFCIGELSTTL